LAPFSSFCGHICRSYLDSFLHEILLGAQIGHAKVAEFFVEEPSLILPQFALAVDYAWKEKEKKYWGKYKFNWEI
jgi:hypothetical protein